MPSYSPVVLWVTRFDTCIAWHRSVKAYKASTAPLTPRYVAYVDIKQIRRNTVGDGHPHSESHSVEIYLLIPSN